MTICAASLRTQYYPELRAERTRDVARGEPKTHRAREIAAVVAADALATGGLLRTNELRARNVSTSSGRMRGPFLKFPFNNPGPPDRE